MKLPVNINLFLVFLKILFLFTVLASGFACTKNSVNAMTAIDCNGAQKSFAADVNPIVQTSCATDSDCHGSGSISGPGELLTYSQIFNARAQISSAIVSGDMPKDASLTASEKNAILCWINTGAENN